MTHWLSRRVVWLRTPGWTERWWWRWRAIHNYWWLVLFFGDRKTTLVHPEFIILYNKYMGGVDRGDQLRGYYSCRTKSRKFYKYIFHFLFDVAITSSYILQKSFCSNSTIKNIKDYQLKLAMQLIGECCSHQQAGRRPVAIRPLRLCHFPVRITSNWCCKMQEGMVYLL